MPALKHINKKLPLLLGLSFLVAGLMFAPSLSSNNFASFTPPALEVRVSAQTFASNQAQEQNRPSNSASSEESESMNVTNMLMGVLAGLVLFLYGVTRLAQGLETIAGDRVKGIRTYAKVMVIAGRLSC